MRNIFLIFIAFVSSCAFADKGQSVCISQEVEILKQKAWDADSANNKTTAKKLFTRLCECNDVEGCINSARFHDTNSKQWKALSIKACQLGHASTCFHLAENLQGQEAKKYYIKGCELPKKLANGMACRMAAKLSKHTAEKVKHYFIRGCDLGDEVSCIEAYKLTDNPTEKSALKKKACEWGIPEICNN